MPAEPFHVDDLVEPQELARTGLPPLTARLGYGLRFAEAIRERLVSRFPEQSFRIIVSIDEPGDVTVRFHRVRPNQSWLADDLESYGSEAVGVFDT